MEKILVARVRHTCAYVKVASGMRKMKANVVAFESPMPKIYAVLPPPREDIDDTMRPRTRKSYWFKNLCNKEWFLD